MARAIDADELLAFLYSESAGTDEQLSDWIEECGLSDAEVIDRAKKLCWTVIEGFINVIKTAPTLTPPNEPLTLKELREMDGEPAWWDDGEGSCWGIISVDSAGMWGGIPFLRGRWRQVNFEYNIEERKMRIYRRPPEGEDET